MQPISGIISGAAQSPVSAAGVKEMSKAKRPVEEPQERRRKPVMDEYVPGEKQVPSGRYLPGKDKDVENPNKKVSGDKEKSCTCNTDKVDREIEKLKKEQKELERKINSETDDAKINELEKKLAQVEKELSQKDNDTYRRQHATYTFGR